MRSNSSVKVRVFPGSQIKSSKINIKKNIIQPNVSNFNDLIIKSLEEFNINEKFESLVDIYYFFKKSKLMYRLSLDKFDLKFSRLNSLKSNISVYSF